MTYYGNPYIKREYKKTLSELEKDILSYTFLEKEKIVQFIYLSLKKTKRAVELRGLNDKEMLGFFKTYLKQQLSDVGLESARQYFSRKYAWICNNGVISYTGLQVITNLVQRAQDRIKMEEDNPEYTLLQEILHNLTRYETNLETFTKVLESKNLILVPETIEETKHYKTSE